MRKPTYIMKNHHTGRGSNQYCIYDATYTLIAARSMKPGHATDWAEREGVAFVSPMEMHNGRCRQVRIETQSTSSHTA